MSVWKIVWWLVATLGVAGTIAVVVGLMAMGPQALFIAARAVREFFRIVLSYRIGCALLAAIAVGLLVDYWRHSRDDAEFARRIAAFEAAQVARDTNIAQQTREAVLQEIANATAENGKLDQEVKEFENELPPTPATGNPYRVGPDAAKLRRIAGQAERGPHGAKRVPAPGRPGRGDVHR